MLYKHSSFFIKFCFLFLTVIHLGSCKNDTQNPKPDISDINVDDVTIVRLEELMAAATKENYVQVYGDIEKQYPQIFKSYYTNFWGLGQGDTMHPSQVYDSLFANTAGNEWMNRLFDSVLLVYKHMDDVEKEIHEAFSYYKYYFPDSLLPQLYSYIGPFVYQVLIDDSTAGIELDMYMGEHFGYYGSFENNMPKYVVTRFDKPYIVVNLMQSMVDGYIYSKEAEAALLDEIIKQGKVLYYLDCMLPDADDSLKIGFTNKQIEWCEQNEEEIWKFLAGQELLFSKRIDDIRRYSGEAPTSVGMPDESPGRAAVWTGWQIVRAYMRENENKTLMQLFNEEDALEILKNSGYRPVN
ncbi:MAG: hypothetical protein ACHQFW_00060 [Chitinophagales bacterium]